MAGQALQVEVLAVLEGQRPGVHPRERRPVPSRRSAKDTLRIQSYLAHITLSRGMSLTCCAEGSAPASWASAARICSASSPRR